MDIQARIPPALCCIHNIIHYHDPNDLRDCEAERAAAKALAGGSVSEPGIYGDMASGFITANERDVMTAKWDEIVDDLWQDHLDYLHNTQHAL